MLLIIVGMFLAALALAGSIITYIAIASQLPPAEEIQTRSLQFETTRILDREGNLLWEIVDPTGGRRTYVTLDQISPHFEERHRCYRRSLLLFERGG